MALTPEIVQARFLTVDGDVGITEEEARKVSRNMFYAGFLGLPLLWLVNCYYFWPVLRYKGDSVIHRYLVLSAVALVLSVTAMLSWSLLFSVGGESLFGDTWRKLAVFNIISDPDTWMMGA